MKQLLLLLLLSGGLSAHAFTIEYSPKSDANQFGVVIVKQDKFQHGQPVVIFLAGIGERGSGSKADLAKISGWGGVNMKGDKYSMFNAADQFGFNIICVQTVHEYEFGEINYAVDYAIRELKADPDQVHCVAVSLGGFGFAREAGKDQNLAKRFASIAMVVMGPGTISTSAVNIANSGRPVWFFTAADDTRNGTNPDVTRNLYKDVVAKGGHAWLTEWPTGGHNIFTRPIGSWYPPLGWRMSTAKGTNATVNIYQWMLNNRIGGAIKSPTDPYVPYVRPVQVQAAPLPTRVPLYIIWSDGTWTAP